MDYKKFTYDELLVKYDSLKEKRSDLMNECAKAGVPFEEFVNKAKDISEDLYYISREMRMKQSPTMEYGKTWKGDTYMMELFIELCKTRQLTDDDGYGYYATENAKSDVLALPSDFENDEYRKDFTHIIWFNK